MKKALLVILFLSANLSFSTLSLAATYKKYLNDHFDSIEISGSAVVEIINGKKPVIYTTKPDNKNYKCRVRVVDNVLHIGARYFPKITIAVPELRNIVVEDDAVLLSKKFRGNNLSIIAKDNAKLNLIGFFNIKNIYQQGNSKINIGWVSSDRLLINSSHTSSTYLAGVANTVIAKITKNAQLDARYLRAHKVSAFTTDKAIAYIMPLYTLRGFAIDKSNIFYHKKPKDLSVVTSDSGNVICANLIR